MLPVKTWFPDAGRMEGASFMPRVLTTETATSYIYFGNTPVSFGEGAQSRSERIGSCYFGGASI